VLQRLGELSESVEKQFDFIRAQLDEMREGQETEIQQVRTEFKQSQDLPQRERAATEGAMDHVKKRLDAFHAELTELREGQEKEVQRFRADLKQSEDTSKRAQAAAEGALRNVKELEEFVTANVFDHSAFRDLKAQVREAVRYLDDESQRLGGRLEFQSQQLQVVVTKTVSQAQKDFKDLELRLMLQSLVAGTFALKVPSMTEDAKSKSLRFLEGEEARVKALSQRSPRARLSEEELLDELTREFPAKPRLQRPSLLGGSCDLALVPAETERQDPRGLVELLSAEIFCIDAMAHDDFSRKICLEALRRRAAELRSSATAEALEAIHAEALAASHVDTIPTEITKPLVVTPTNRRISVTERL